MGFTRQNCIFCYTNMTREPSERKANHFEERKIDQSYSRKTWKVLKKKNCWWTEQQTRKRSAKGDNSDRNTGCFFTAQADTDITASLHRAGVKGSQPTAQRQKNFRGKKQVQRSARFYGLMRPGLTSTKAMDRPKYGERKDVLMIPDTRSSVKVTSRLLLERAHPSLLMMEPMMVAAQWILKSTNPLILSAELQKGNRSFIVQQDNDPKEEGLGLVKSISRS